MKHRILCELVEWKRLGRLPYTLEITPTSITSPPLLFAKFVVEVYLSPIYALLDHTKKI